MSDASDIKYVKTIDHLERLNVSQFGNPRFRIYFTDGTEALTETDGSVNFGLENAEFRNVPLLITATRAGRVKHVTRAYL